MKGHIRQRSHGSWELRYDFGTDPATGKRRIATSTVRGNRKDAEKELRRLLRTLDVGEHVDPTRLTVRQWLGQWLEIVRVEVSPKTFERYAGIVNNNLVPVLGAVLIAKLSVADIQTAYSEMATGGRKDGKEGGLSGRTRRHIHRVLFGALGRAVELKMMARNPAADIKKKRLPKIERKDLVTLTAAQGHSLLHTMRNSRVYWPTLLALATGMRRGEILALRWGKVDLERGVLEVAASLEQTRDGLRFKPPKNNKPRAVTLPAFAIEALRRCKKQQAEELLALGVRQDRETLVCGRYDGSPKSPLALTQEFARYVKRTRDIPRVTFHGLRHSHATELLRNGVPLKVVSERLGHAGIAITADLYSHTDADQADAAVRLNDAFNVAMPVSGGHNGVR
jgi:integrase